MKYKNFWKYFVFGAIIGLIVGIMKGNFPVWLGVGALLGFLVAIFIESKLKSLEPEKVMWFGFLLLVPVMFFKGYLKETVWWDVFGILAVIGSFIILVNFGKIMRKKKDKKKK